MIEDNVDDDVDADIDEVWWRSYLGNIYIYNNIDLDIDIYMAYIGVPGCVQRWNF